MCLHGTAWKQTGHEDSLLWSKIERCLTYFKKYFCTQLALVLASIRLLISNIPISSILCLLVFKKCIEYVAVLQETTTLTAAKFIL